MAKKKFWKTSEFKKIQAAWYDKLKASGFSDIDPGDETMIQPKVFLSPEHKTQYTGGLDHYQLCQAILREFKFEKVIHRKIFELHSEGLSRREIETWLKQNTCVELTDRAIQYIINRIKDQYQKG